MKTLKMEQNSVIKFASDTLKQFNGIVQHPEDFLVPNAHSHPLKLLLKHIYDFAKNDGSRVASGDGLPELIVQSFGAEEIWSQLELENESTYFKLLKDVANIASNRHQLVNNTEKVSFHDADDVRDENTNDIQSEVDSDVSDELPVVDDQNDEEDANDVDDGRKGGDAVDAGDGDIFFDGKEMERFLCAEDKKMMKGGKPHKQNGSDDDDSDGSIDLFAESDGDEDDEADDGADMKYDSFFDAPGDKSHGYEAEKERDDEEVSGDDEVEPVSSLELRQGRLEQRVEELEVAALAEKGWQLRGEARAGTRPHNSLLEEALEFDVAARPHLVVTEYTNMQLEDVILQRIKDKAWDSVKRKARPVDAPTEFRKRLVLDQEKSKESLAQVYEREYVAQRDAADADTEVADPAEKTATTALVDRLFGRLDALSHFYFTPRVVRPDAVVVSNLPAVTMEEVAPVAISDAALLAPEEVQAKHPGPVMARDERTATDKKRERRLKKVKQRARRLQQEQRLAQPAKGGARNTAAARHLSAQLLKQVTKDRNTSQMTASAQAVGASSDKFFKQLEDQVKTQIETKIGKKHKNTTNNRFIAKKLKL